MRGMRYLIALSGSASLICSAVASATIYRVDGSVSSSGNGSSWAQAIKTIQEVLAIPPTSADEIWVKAGTYKPNDGLSQQPQDPRTAVFHLPSGVKFRGGFAGGESSASQADPFLNQTILSGDRFNSTGCSNCSQDDPDEFDDEDFDTYDDNNYHRGAKIAVLEGDPAKPGPFVFRIKLPDGYRVPPHTHPKVERITVIQGTLNIGMGEKVDADATQPMPALTYGYWPAGMTHFVWTRGETVLQFHGEGPWSINYVNPADDPRNGKK